MDPPSNQKEYTSVFMFCEVSDQSSWLSEESGKYPSHPDIFTQNMEWWKVTRWGAATVPNLNLQR